MNLDCAVLDCAGFDSAAGLKVMGGKAERYAKLLQKLVDRQSGAVEEIRAALDAVLSGTAAPAKQTPSIGCNIKWKPGNEPPYFG